MDLKKIMALAMIAFLAIPNLIMVRADGPEDGPKLADGADLADAIARARLYLSKVRTSVETLAGEYTENEMVQGYLNEIYDLLGQYEKAPEILLETNGDAGDEARIVIQMPSEFTLGDLATLSWLVNTESGYPPHVDITLDTTNSDESMLTAELAVNNPSYSPPTYGTYDTWLETFEMASADGYGEIDDTTVLWVTKMGAGDQDAPSSTLANWKLGTIDNDPGSELQTTEINSETLVLKLEIEVDNWIAQTSAYVKDIEINGVPETFEEEAGEAKYFLDQASAYLDDNEFNLAARNLAAARNILGRVNGLLNSMAKAHKVTMINRFMEQVEHRIEGIVNKVDKLSGRLGEGKAKEVRAAMGHAWGNISQMGDNPSDDEVNDAIDSLEYTTEGINEALGTLDGYTSNINILEAMDRLEAKIRVLNATSQRLTRKGLDTSDVDAELIIVESLLNEAVDLLVNDNTEDAEDLIREAGDIVSEANKNIRRIRKEHQNKGGKGKGKG